MPTKYRYLKKYYPPFRNFKFAFRFFAVSFLFLGLVLISNAVTPIFSYQLVLSPHFKKEEVVSPIGDKAIKDSLSIYVKSWAKILGRRTLKIGFRKLFILS